MPTCLTPSGFARLNVPSYLCDLLASKDIVTPTPIQAGAIPVAMDGRDLIGVAQTGTGKTLAFGLPMVTRLKFPQVGLVLAPTRELAQQIAESLGALQVPCALVVGGASMSKQVSDLRRKPQVIVATPGRLIDHMQQKTVSLRDVSIAVLDEGDRMLDMGFAPAIRQILAALPEKRQTLLFSATMPTEIEALAQEFLTDPERIEVAPSGTAAELVEQEVVFMFFGEKHETLETVLRESQGSTLVFVRTRHGARKLAKSLRDRGHTASEIHSDRTLAQRRQALAGFKDGSFRILVATDVAARGIDVKEISLVVNFDVPEQCEDYVHRIGRTGRAGAEGKAVTFALKAQAQSIRTIQRIMGRDIPVSTRSTDVPRGFEIGRTRPQSRPQPERQAQQVEAAREERPLRQDRPERHRHGHNAPVKPHTQSHPQPRVPNPGTPKPVPAAQQSSSPDRKGHRGWSGRPGKRRTR